jgi:DNA polymerase-3 subunit delta'
MDFRRAATLPWLAAAQRRLREAASAGRLPHSLLLLSVPGLGVEALAAWIVAFALCEQDSRRPCGDCPACLLLTADSHPDAHVVRLEDDVQQIKVDQVRELITALSLKSYRGGFKVGVIEGAETLNLNGANAFLKTLEEPTADTVLILTARPTHRLPATVASRCLKIVLRPPAPELAVAWLAAQAAAPAEDAAEVPADWRSALALAGGAPLRAAELAHAGLAALDREMLASLRDLVAGTVDLSLIADGWARSDPVLRVLWLENWLTARIRSALGVAPRDETAKPVRLPRALLKPKIRASFELLDAARHYRRLAATGMNQQLALEALLQGGLLALAQ